MQNSHSDIAAPNPSRHRRRGLFFIGLACGATGFGMALQGGLNAFFVVHEIGMSATQQGYLEALRETCGITALLILAALSGFAESLVASVMLLFVAAGMLGYAYAPSFTSLLLLSLVWSQGLHVWMPLPNSMTLSLAEPGRSGKRLGQIQAAGFAGAVLALALAWLTSDPHTQVMSFLSWVYEGTGLDLRGLDPTAFFQQIKVGIRDLYKVSAVAMVAGAAACLCIPRGIKTPGPRLVFRRRYGLYYLMSFLEGWRKQIFLCFSGYLLAKKFDASLSDLLLLWVGAQLLGYFLSPRAGKLIDRVGERKVLVFYYTSMTAVFIGYAFIPNKHLLYGLFIVDSAFFAFNTALTTYVSRIAPQAEHTATLSMGVAMNHVAAVSMPLLGGIVWDRFGYQAAFLLGSAAAVLSVIVAFRVPPRGGGRPMDFVADVSQKDAPGGSFPGNGKPGGNND